MERVELFLYCSKCNAKIEDSLLGHWKLVHWPKKHKLYQLQYLYERDVRKVIKEDKMSNCCNAQVYDPSGLGIEGRCKDCLEMCLIVGGNNE